jgi:hypothetical protein
VDLVVVEILVVYLHRTPMVLMELWEPEAVAAAPLLDYRQVLLAVTEVPVSSSSLILHKTPLLVV